MDKLARLFALIGGCVLSLLVVQTCLSIVGRSLNSILHGDFMQSAMPDVADMLLATGVGPINGDFELVQSGMAFVIFAFLPICQLSGAHASVDIFIQNLPTRINHALRMITEVVFAIILVVIAFQFYQGTLSKMNSGQTTFLLQFPLWWAYAFALTGAVATAVVAVYVAAMRLAEVVTQRQILPTELEAGH
jgi:TRAP-type C4-dicarboxylate transport system permease small subunit